MRFFDPEGEVEKLAGNLPHWRQWGTVYFVTFRAADSLPQSLLQRWQRERSDWLRAHREPLSDAEQAEYRKRFPARMQRWLDRSYGDCLLADPATRQIVESTLRYFDGDRYRLDEFVVAANHVHAIVEPGAAFPLSTVIAAWKSFSATQINQLHRRRGPFWQKESFDHIIRSPVSLDRFRAYIRAHGCTDA